MSDQALGCRGSLYCEADRHRYLVCSLATNSAYLQFVGVLVGMEEHVVDVQKMIRSLVLTPSWLVGFGALLWVTLPAQAGSMYQTGHLGDSHA